MGNALEPFKKHYKCFFCKADCKTALGCTNDHGGCTKCLQSYFIDCIQNDKLCLDQIPCPYCRTLIKPKTVTYVLQSEYLAFPQKKPNQQFFCAIHIGNTHPEEGYRLSCGDSFCKLCLSELIKLQIKDGKVTGSFLKCPSCEEPLKYQEVIDNVPEEFQDRFNVFYLQTIEFSDEIVRRCPNCYFFVSVPLNQTKIRCPGCTYFYCVKCNIYHEGACEDFNKSIRIEGVVNCPECKEGIQKKSGCNFLLCTWYKCNGRTCFCYLCGEKLSRDQHFSHFGKYGPFGEGCLGLNK